MKKFIKRAAKKIFSEVNQNLSAATQIQQRNQYHFYQMLRNRGEPLPKFSETGFRAYSQNDEDGLLLYIFSLIGATNKVCAELAFGNPYGANTTNLICNWGWTGLAFEGSAKLVALSRRFFAEHPDTGVLPPRIINAWITAENINDLFKEQSLHGEIDLLSLDIDGVDYWIWKALEIVRPRVVVAEILDFWGAERAVTVPYDPAFTRDARYPDFFGASLAAFVKLGKEKGYRLIGCNKYGFNAFFIRNDVGLEYFPEVQSIDCLNRSKLDRERNRLLNVQSLGWVDV